ncbi:MAG: hypothetical protein GXP00_05360 [Alphaproteobacteria bacterium]|nr:hypothetical protein [Alphaproteobacteria bacterium]
MQNSSIKFFWCTFLFIFLFGSVGIVQWALAVVVGDYSLVEGFNDAFKYSTFGSYLLESEFRLIPYVILGLIVIFLKKENRAKIGIAWGGLLGVAGFILWGYWVAQSPYYTNEHVSSTTAVAFIFIPIYAVAPGLIGGIIGGVYTAFFRKKEMAEITK